jgi:hypothetical protein
MNQWGKIVQTSAHRRFRNGEDTSVVEYLHLPEEMLTTLWGMIPFKSECPMLTAADFERLKKTRDAVICTFANPEKRAEYKEKGFLTSFPIYSNRSDNQDYVVIYNGLSHVPWVRQTVTPGWIHTEYASKDSKNDILRYEVGRGNQNGTITTAPDFVQDTPPLEWEERIEGNLFRVGRMATYIPGYLSSLARSETKKFLEEL